MEHDPPQGDPTDGDSVTGSLFTEPSDGGMAISRLLNMLLTCRPLWTDDPNTWLIGSIVTVDLRGYERDYNHQM